MNLFRYAEYHRGEAPHPDFKLKGGPDVPEQTTQTVKNVPYLPNEINFGASEAKSLYNSLMGGYKSREQIYNDLKPQYTTQSSGGSMFVTPDGRIVDLDDYQSVSNYYIPQNISGDSGGGAIIPMQGTLNAWKNSGKAPEGWKSLGSGTAGTTDFDALNAAVDAAIEDQGDASYSYYPNSTVVPFSQATEDALAMLEARARNGSDLNAAAQRNTLDTLNGKYLTESNPYLNSVIDQTSKDITDNYLNSVVPSVNSTFAQSGRYGSGMHFGATQDANQTLADSLGQTIGNIRYQNYNDERSRMGAYSALAPTLAQNDYTDISQLANVGSARENLDRAYLQDDIDRFYFNQDAPSKLLDDYISRITALNGGYGTSTQTGTNPAAYSQGGSTMGGIISGASTGLGIGSMMAAEGATGMAALGGPWGIGLGVGGALLGGLFS